MKHHTLRAALTAACILAAGYAATVAAQDTAAQTPMQCCMKGDGATGSEQTQAMREKMKEHMKDMKGMEHGTGRGPADAGMGMGQQQGGPGPERAPGADSTHQH